MATRKPLVITSGVVQRLQSGDILAASDVENVVTATNVFATDNVLVQTNGTARVVDDTTIATANVVQAASNFGATDQLIVSSGTTKNLQSAAILSANLVTAAAVFNTDNRVLRADGAGRGAQFATATIEDTGQVILRPDSTLEYPILSANLLSAAGWISTDWTGSFETGWTHTTGNTTGLTNTLAAVVGTYYSIDITVSGRTAGTFTASFGGRSLAGGANGLFQFGPLAVSTASLSITPTSTFDGTLLISISSIDAFSPPALAVFDSNGSLSSFEVRTRVNAQNNLGLGVNALGRALSSAVNNLCLGTESGRSITTGIGNFTCGITSGRDITTGSQNCILGSGSSPILTIGGSNTVIGGSAGTALTTADFNTLIGRNAGNSLTTATQTVFVGLNAGNNASQSVAGTNMIAIGASTFCTSSNQAMFGNASVTSTILRGAVDVVRGTNACLINIYNTSGDAIPGANFERLASFWSGNIARIETQKGAGGGTARALALGTDGTIRTQINSDGTVLSGSCFQPSYAIAGYGVGTNYTLTATAAEVDRGTTDSAVVLAQAGTYRLSGRVVVRYVAATFLSERTITVKFRRTNNTPADVINGSIGVPTFVLSTLTAGVEVTMPEVIYSTANSDDRIALFADVSTTPSAGSLEISYDTVFAHRLA